MTVGVVDRHWCGLSECVLETNQRRDLVAKAVLINLEEQIELQQQTLDEVGFEADGAVHHVESQPRHDGDR